MILTNIKPKQQGLRGLRGLKGLSHYCVMSDSDSDLVSVVKSTALVKQRRAALTICSLTFLKKEKASPNSPLLLKRLGYQLVMNLQHCH